MIKAFFNAFKIKELRKRLLFTAGIIILVRVAASIPCPGVDPAALADYFEKFGSSGAGGMFVSMFDMFTGGALQKFAIATLGIMPYISASIIMQLMVPVLPSLEKMSREGESGRQKITQYTRYLTVLICIVQGTMAAMAMINPGKIGLPVPETSLVFDGGVGFIFMTVTILTASTMIMMWLGERITERGLGNGVSIIITINIIARLPSALVQLVQMAMKGATDSGATFKPVHLLLLLVVFALVTAATILLTQGQRRIPIQMVRKSYGNEMQSNSTYLPLKVNFAGVMPIIFAGAIMMVPGFLFNFLKWYNMSAFFRYGGFGYMLAYGLMIMGFSYFWVANQFNPIQISDNLKKEGAFIPGIRPGNATADFLDKTMTRVTFAGSLFLTALAIFPMFLYNSFKIPFMVASFFGGTSLLIMVGVLLDTLSQMESHLTMRNYDGFLKKGKLKSRQSQSGVQ
ncbi:MAG: preprotein translocase subunit SecY [Victivallaceae bacterium]|nr:preprotein translocase subunit SecY [Victivallaceae bacterium]